MKLDQTPEEAAQLDAHIYSTDEVATVYITNTGVQLKFAVPGPTTEQWLYVAETLRTIAADLCAHVEERMVLLNSTPEGNA